MVQDTPMELKRKVIMAAVLAGLPVWSLSAARAEPVPAAQSEDTRLARVFIDDARREDELDPVSALYRGEQPDPKALAQLYTDALDRRLLASTRQSLAELGAIDRTKLSPERRISYDVFASDKRDQAAWLQPDIRALVAVRPFNHFGGAHVEFPSIVGKDGLVRYASEADYRQALLLDDAMAGALDNATVRFREGIATGVVEPKLTVRIMIAQIDAILAQPAEESPFYSPVLAFPDAVPEVSRPALRQAYSSLIRDRIYPAYRRLRAFLADEYLPAARDSVGLSQMKGGGDLYRMLIERQTTLKLDPEEVHKLGLSEVARIQAEMEGVKRELGYDMPLHAFFDNIRTDPRFHPRTREELAQGFAKVAKQVDALAPSYFSKMPKTPLLIQPYPAYREKYEAGGSYNQGSADGTRPGVFYYNAYDLPSRFLSGITTLYLHEGAPGHHFQISLAQENESLPAFQRFDGNTAYVEGWALYAETLGYEMGFYKDPMQHWGTLDDEMLRAMRLVVDTGLHTKGWSRDQAIDYMLTNSGMGRSDATAEVERYIANPAQALAYKLGALTIQRLRKKAEAALGPKFNIRAFHEQILGSGALPLPVLEAKIDGWIAASR
jgi:uncharacterized protein (DUF885 family)